MLQVIFLFKWVSLLAAECGNGVTDALLAVGGCEDVVDAGLDLLDGVQVAAVLHRLCRTGL